MPLWLCVAAFKRSNRTFETYALRIHQNFSWVPFLDTDFALGEIGFKIEPPNSHSSAHISLKNHQGLLRFGTNIFPDVFGALEPWNFYIFL